MITKLPAYDEARKAIRGGKKPTAFLHLGILYANGIGTTQNHILACYFYMKAFYLGCQEAYAYLSIEYESIFRDFSNEINAALAFPQFLSSQKKAQLKEYLEKERLAGNYGVISRIHKHLELFYPSYSKEQAIKDILNNCDTTDADIFYSLSTQNIAREIYIPSQESVLSQLYAPFSKSKRILKHFTEDILSEDESSLVFCIGNLITSYNDICEHYKVERQELSPLEPSEQYPYLSVSALVRIRKQALKCLLSIKDIDPIIRDQFLNELDNDKNLLDISEKIKNQGIQLFIISFVELNIDIEAWEIITLSLLRAFRNGNLTRLAEHLNASVKRLTDAGIKHRFPTYTADNLPPIKLPSFGLTNDNDSTGFKK